MMSFCCCCSIIFANALGAGILLNSSVLGYRYVCVCWCLLFENVRDSRFFSISFHIIKHTDEACATSTPAKQRRHTSETIIEKVHCEHWVTLLTYKFRILNKCSGGGGGCCCCRALPMRFQYHSEAKFISVSTAHLTRRFASARRALFALSLYRIHDAHDSFVC